MPKKLLFTSFLLVSPPRPSLTLPVWVGLRHVVRIAGERAPNVFGVDVRPPSLGMLKLL